MVTESGAEETFDLMNEFSSRTYSNNLLSSDLDSGMRNNSIFRSSAISCLFALIAWNYPRYLIDSESSIADKTPPYQQTQAGDVILDFRLNHPVVDPPTIPFVLASRSSRSQQRLANIATAVGSFAMAIGMSEGATVILKLWIQRPRPNYYSLCGFDNALLRCTADLDHVREANFSFPSGNNVGSTIRLSRNGLGLGFATCTIAYHTWYPPIWSKLAGIPLSLSRVDTMNISDKLPSFHE
eukprot:scaffold7755_cov104-Cylindrotheca_fusiformis.AAC.8